MFGSTSQRSGALCFRSLRELHRHDYRTAALESVLVGMAQHLLIKAPLWSGKDTEPGAVATGSTIQLFSLCVRAAPG